MECKDFLNAVSKIPQNTFDGIIASLVLKKFDFGNGYVPSEFSIAVFSSNSQDDLKNSVSGAMLSSLGMNYISEDNLLTAAQNLRTQLGTSFETDFAASKIVYQPATKTYKLKMLVGDDTWAAARSWVAEEYDPGDVTEGDSDFFCLSISSLVNGSYSNLDSCYVSPLDMVSALQNVRLNACIDYFNIDLSAVNFMIVRMESNSTTHCQIFALDSAYLKYLNGSFYASDGTSIVQWTSYQIWGDNLQYHSQYTDRSGIGVIGSDYSFLYNLGSYSAGASVGTAASDLVDNPTYDYSNAGSGEREIAVSLTPAATLTANIIIDGVHGFSVSNEENTILLTKTAQDIINEDMSGTVLSISAQS